LNPVALKKHMLGAAKTDAFSAKGLCHARLVGLIRIGSHTERPSFIGPLHEPGVLLERL
jgi:hypothetical protein